VPARSWSGSRPRRRQLETDSKMGKPTELLQGTLDLLILKTLALEPMHGWASHFESSRSPAAPVRARSDAVASSVVCCHRTPRRGLIVMPPRQHRRVFMALRSFLRQGTVDHELDEELRFHLDQMQKCSCLPGVASSRDRAARKPCSSRHQETEAQQVHPSLPDCIDRCVREHLPGQRIDRHRWTTPTPSTFGCV